MVQKILILGATGPSGLAFAREALSQTIPPELLLYVRDPTKIPEEIATRVQVVKGQLADQTSLEAAMKGVDVVVSYLGAQPTLSALVFRTRNTPIANAFETVFAAMRAQGVKRILAMSTTSVVVEDDRHTWSRVFTWHIPHLLIPQADAEMLGIGEAVSSQKDLDWTVFRVNYLGDGPAELEVHAGFPGPDFQGGLTVSRKSMARWTFQEISAKKWVNRSPVLGS